MSLEQLIAGRTDLWCGRTPMKASRPAHATGYPALDALLGGGWPRAAVTEVLEEHAGCGTLDLVLPALARLSEGEGWIALVAPPLTPFAAGFAGAGVRLDRLLWIEAQDPAERLWALEQALRSGTCSAVVGWADGSLDRVALRRLQLAADGGDALGLLILPSAARKQASFSALRLCIRRRAQQLEVEILKRRGGWPVPPQLIGREEATAHPGGSAGVRAVPPDHGRDPGGRRLCSSGLSASAGGD